MNTVCKATILSAVFLVLSCSANADETKQPNVLLIISDDLGLDASSQYSYSTDLPNTPTLNSLAKTGIVFDNAWATPSCTTTRGTLITGLHGINSGVDTVPNNMDTSLNTIQRLLKNDPQTHQYQSAVIGKWHLAGRGSDRSHPNKSGVDYYAGNISGVLEDYSEWELTRNGETSVSDIYHTKAISEIAIDWISRQSEPWFAWLAYAAPHSPFHLPPADLVNSDLSGTTIDIKQNKRDYYLAAIEAMDTSMGTVINSLSDKELKNTLIIYVGDNGTPGPVVDRNAFARTKAKGTLYEGGIRVPMTISGAGVSRTNQRENALVSTVDLYATIAEAAGVGSIGDIDGQSIYGLLSDSNIATRKYNYAEFKGKRVNGWTVRDKNYKLIESDEGEQQLYDLANDFKENNNLLLSNASQYQGVVKELAAYATTIRGNTTNSKMPMVDDSAQSAVGTVVDLTDLILDSTNSDCASYAQTYRSTATDVGNNERFTGELTISVSGDECVFNSNAIPNHDFNDGGNTFRHQVEVQDSEYRITANPSFANQPVALRLDQDNAVLLNGVKVDILAAGCFNVGNGRIGCNDLNQPWRFDPMYEASGFRVDSHHAHTQPNGAYHYHGPPNALYDAGALNTVVGFAADGFPIFSSYVSDEGSIKKVKSSYRLKSGLRPTGEGNPGGTYDGTFRDDYEYVEGQGDLDRCNGMQINGVYGYYITDEYPYILACFKGEPHESFNKRQRR